MGKDSTRAFTRLGISLSPASSGPPVSPKRHREGSEGIAWDPGPPQDWYLIMTLHTLLARTLLPHQQGASIMLREQQEDTDSIRGAVLREEQRQQRGQGKGTRGTGNVRPLRLQQTQSAAQLLATLPQNLTLKACCPIYHVQLTRKKLQGVLKDKQRNSWQSVTPLIEIHLAWTVHFKTQKQFHKVLIRPSIQVSSLPNFSLFSPTKKKKKKEKKLKAHLSKDAVINYTCVLLF